MTRRKRKKRRFNSKLIGLGVLTLAVAGLGLFYFFAANNLTERKVTVGGREIKYRQGGHGAHVVVLAPKDNSAVWEKAATSWLDSYTLSVLEDAGAEALSAVLSAIRAETVYLVGFDKTAPAAIERAAESKERVSKLILISPVLDQSWPWRARAALVTQPALLLWGRNDPEIHSPLVGELTRGLPNAQMSFHPQARHDLLLENPDWVASKVRDFIAHTR